MLRLVKETWLPTVVFSGLPAVVCAGLLHESQSSGIARAFVGAAFIATGVLVVPPVWRTYVMVQGRPHAGRAAFSGAALGYVIAVLPLMVFWASGDALNLLAGRRPDPGLGAFLLILPIFFILGAVPVAGALGAVVGSMIALIQRWSSGPAQEPRPAATLLDGAISGGQVGALGGTFIALLTTAALTEPVTRALDWPILPLGLVLLSIWLLTIGLSASCGVAWARRMRQLDARDAAARST